MNENTMTQFKAEGEPAFPVAESKENDNSADSSTGEKTSEDQTPSDGGEQKPDENKDDHTKKDEDENFANHPRWKEREEDWKNRFNDQEKRHTDEIEKLRVDLEGKITGASKDANKTPTEVPAWFGGDEAAWQQFLEWNEQQAGRVKSDALNEIKSTSEREQKAIDEATKYFNDTVAEIEADKTINPDGSKVDRNKLLKFVLDNDLVDSKGRWNYKAGFQMMKASSSTAKNPSLDEKKKVADATKSENKSETKQPQFSTSEDFKKPGARPW